MEIYTNGIFGKKVTMLDGSEDLPQDFLAQAANAFDIEKLNRGEVCLFEYQPARKDGELEFEELFRVDLGKQINSEVGGSYFAVGEWMQFVCMVSGLKVWIFLDARQDSFRLGFGESPDPLEECQDLSYEEAMKLIMAKVQEVSDVVR